jgi:hypothetical protein
MNMTDVLEVLSSAHAHGTPGPNGVEFSVYFERSNLPRTGTVRFRVECGSGIAGRSGAWNVIEIGGPALGPKVKTRRALRAQVLAAMAEGIRPDPLPGREVYARWHTYGLTSSVQWFTRRVRRSSP